MEQHESELKEKIQESTKMEKVKEGDFSEVQKYLKEKSVENARMAFEIRCEMVEDIKANFKSKHKIQGGEEALICQDCHCKEIQTQRHCLVCPEWEDIRTGLELDKI